MILGSQAEQTIPRENDLLATDREDYLEAWWTTAYHWMLQPRANLDQYVDHILSELPHVQNTIATQHSIIADHLVDLEYDDTYEVSLKTAQQGFLVLQLAVAKVWAWFKII